MTESSIPSNPISIRRISGGSIKTTLTSSICLNENSSIQREFITIDDDKSPASIVACVGVMTIYKGRTDYSVGGYNYLSKYAISATEEIRAFELRFLVFNIWGEHIRTLSSTHIEDVSAGAVVNYDGEWNLFSESEASEHYASIAYIATIRTSSGRVYKMDTHSIVLEARRFSEKFTDTNLEPTK